MANLKISIALCTYNGGKYLRQQLDSIGAQTRLPDELIVCDDHSHDDTEEIVNDFIKKAQFPVRLFINEINLGSSKNFEKAINLCNGNIIALSDQDDIWYQEKLALIESIFLENPEVGLVFGDADVVDQNTKPMGYSLWRSTLFGKRDLNKINNDHAFDVLLRYNVVTGATMAFRSFYRENVMPIPAAWVHDGWISIIISVIVKINAIDRPVIKYRQHIGQQIGAKKITRTGVFIKELKKSITNPHDYHDISNTQIERDIDRFRLVYERISKLDDVNDKTRVLALLQNKINHLQTRKDLPYNRLLRILIIIKEFILLRYHRYSYDEYIIKDLL